MSIKSILNWNVIENIKTKDYQMSVDAHVSGSACQTLVFSIWNVFVGVNVNVQLGKTEVDDVDHLVATQRRSADL
jgi:YbbR domain-containing protein